MNFKIKRLNIPTRKIKNFFHKCKFVLFFVFSFYICVICKYQVQAWSKYASSDFLDSTPNINLDLFASVRLLHCKFVFPYPFTQ